jgi:hypothetical protein
MARQDGLWRLATALCRQLQIANAQIADALALRGNAPPRTRRSRTLTNVTQMMRAAPREALPGSTIDATELNALPPFTAFTAAELAHVLSFAMRYDLPSRRVVYREGEPGDSCFIVVKGHLDVSVKARGRRHLLAQLSPGAMFGQASLATDEVRAETCSVRRDVVLAQLSRGACETLLGTRSPAALKFLAAFNHGLTDALRTANRRLVELSNAP